MNLVLDPVAQSWVFIIQVVKYQVWVGLGSLKSKECVWFMGTSRVCTCLTTNYDQYEKMCSNCYIIALITENSEKEFQKKSR